MRDTTVVEKFKRIPAIFNSLFAEPSKDEIKKNEDIVIQAERLVRLKMNDDFIKGYIPLLEEIKKSLEKQYLSPGIDKDTSERARLQASLLLEIDARITRRISEGVTAEKFLEKQEKTNVG
jgi:hypothetical protein